MVCTRDESSAALHSRDPADQHQDRREAGEEGEHDPFPPLEGFETRGPENPEHGGGRGGDGPHPQGCRALMILFNVHFQLARWMSI